MPAVSVLPGPGKDAVAFQQDEQVCQRHAMAHTGYADAVPAGAASAANPPTQPSRRGRLRAVHGVAGRHGAGATHYAATSYGYAYGYPYPYFYPYAAPYPFFGGGLYADWGWGGWGHGGWGHGGWHGWHGGGWHGGGWHGGGHR